MMRWVSDVIWFVCRALAWLMQLAGFAGLLLAALIGIYALAGKAVAPMPAAGATSPRDSCGIQRGAAAACAKRNGGSAGKVDAL